MPPKCKICSNGHLKQVNKLLAKQRPLRDISLQVLGDVKHFMSVARHAEHLGYDFKTIQREKSIESAIDVHKEFLEQLDFAKKLRVAAEDYLTVDSEISLDVRSDELNVVYLDLSDCDEKGNPTKKTETLDALIRSIGKGKIIITIGSKRVDIRSFALDAIKTCDIVIDKFAKLGGDYQSDRTNDADRARELRSQLRSKAADAVIRELAQIIQTLPDEYQERFSLDVESAYDEMITQLVGMDDDKLKELSLPFTKKDLMLLKS